MPHLAARAVPAALLALLLSTAPAQAAQDARTRDLRTNRVAAERALAHAERIASGQGVRTGRELTPALAELFQRRAALAPAGRAAARELLARPVLDRAACNVEFCVHWTNSGTDRPPQAGTGPGDPRPDYIDTMLDTFEQVEAAENDGLGWAAPPPDTGDPRTDVYVKDLPDGLYGTATPESTGSGVAAYVTMDNDYSATEFPTYAGNFLPPLQVTAAHEYNHVLQFGYDVADRWMAESTATWMEDKVFPAVDDYHLYMGSWAELSTLPITEFDNGKIYGSAIWNHWLDRRFGADVIRTTWEVSEFGGSFAPGAYDAAIKTVAPGSGFARELIDFSVATAEWDAPNSGIFEGPRFPRDVLRFGGVPATPFALDHTAYALFDVPASGAPALDLTGSLPAGTAGAIGLVGFDGNITTAVATLLSGGQGAVTLPDPGRFSRITAVAVNADTTRAGVSGSDWLWARDDQPVALAVSAQGPPAPPPAPPPPPPPASPASPASPELKLATGSVPRLGRLARRGILPIVVEVSGPGRMRARATVDKATAKRLKVGRRTTTVGKGALTVTKAGRATLRIKLTKKARKGLERQRRTLRIRVRTTFTPSGGAAVTRTLSIFLRP